MKTTGEVNHLNLYRLLTRSDLDGLACAVLMKHLNMVDEIVLVDHPSIMQNRSIPVSDRDITTNLPYVKGVHLAIDHHVSETLRNPADPRHIIDPDAPSAARVVYDHFGGREKFSPLFDEMMAEVDKADSGKFSKDEILHPRRWALLNFLVDQRTGIEDWGKYRIGERRFKMGLIGYCGRLSIDDILRIEDVRQRAETYFAYEDRYREQVRTAAFVHKNIVIQDFRYQERIFPGNRFIVYALFPRCNLSILIRRDKKTKDIITFSVGKSILNPSSTANIGELMLSYGGGGHRAAGACHVAEQEADGVLSQLVQQLADDSLTD